MIRPDVTGTVIFNLWVAAPAVLMLVTAASSPALAQEPATRAEANRQRREEKSRELQPYKPNGFERAMDVVQQKAIFINGRDGLYPKLGSLATGSGFTAGAGYRDRDLFGQPARWISGRRGACSATGPPRPA